MSLSQTTEECLGLVWNLFSQLTYNDRSFIIIAGRKSGMSCKNHML